MDKILLKNNYTQKLNLILIVFVGTLLLTLSAKIKVPFIPVPMTMQTFMVLFLGYYLGPKLGLATTAKIFIKVDLPAPFGPSNPNISPCLIDNVIFFSASTLPVFVRYVLHTFLTSNAIELFIN